MRGITAAFCAIVLIAAPALAQSPAELPSSSGYGDPGLSSGPTTSPGAMPSSPVGPTTGRNITATGRTMPPVGGRAPAGQIRASTQDDMLKAQKQAEERNKAWDSKMKKTMGSICSGC